MNGESTMYFIDDKKRYVRDIQKYINIISRMKKTIPRVSIDGIYGRETKNSIFIFQQNNNINPTGVLDKATFDVLFREYAALLELELASKYVLTSRAFPISLGMQGEDILMLNLILEELSNTYDITVADKTGYFNKTTESAIKDLQKIFGLEENGIVDAIFYDRLWLELDSTRLSDYAGNLIEF